VPPDAPETGAAGRSPERMLHLVLLQHATEVRAEDELPTQMTMRLERGQHLVAERDLSRAPALRRGDDLARDGAPDRELSLDQVDVLPAQRQDLPLPHPGP